MSAAESRSHERSRSEFVDEPVGLEAAHAHGAARGPRGVVPFRFACTRCGNCCSGGHGYVWLTSADVERMARALGATSASFARRFVRDVVDPRSGERRFALREDESGRCALLVGKNTCSVYGDRPAQCSAFPYWDSVLTDRATFESARATCPGIAVVVEPEVARRAFARLAELHARLGMGAERRVCCLTGVHLDEPSADAGTEVLYVTGLEADYAVALAARGALDEHSLGPADSADDARREPSGAGRVEERTESCALGRARPIACRAADDHERCTEHLRELRALEREVGYPAAYGPLRELLAARGGLG